MYEKLFLLILISYLNCLIYVTGIEHVTMADVDRTIVHIPFISLTKLNVLGFLVKYKFFLYK